MVRESVQADGPEIKNDHSPNLLDFGMASLLLPIDAKHKLKCRSDSWTLVEKLVMYPGINPWTRH